MRVVLVLTLLAGCVGGTSGQALNTPPPKDDSAAGACFSSADCIPAAATCCECPSFATSIDDPKVQACQPLDCDVSACPTNVEAQCEAQQCVLACAQLECLDCPAGYTTEANGCLSCTCSQASTQTPTCRVDSDCTRVRADCCGCANGGQDTAVATSNAAAFDQSLMCSSSPQCPGIGNQSCNPADEARCIEGQCALSPEPFPSDACGRPDLPACPAGTVCRINANDSASLYGVGVCRP